MRYPVILSAAGLLLAGVAAPPAAAPVNYWVQLSYIKLTDDPTPPPKTFVYPMQGSSVEAVMTMCTSEMSLLRLSRHVLDRNLKLQGRWYANGGECVRDRAGNIKMTAGALPKGRN